MAGIGTKTFAQFLALKCFDILKRLRVFQEAQNSPLTPLQYRQYFAQAEQDCAPFIESAYRIAAEMANETRSDT